MEVIVSDGSEVIEKPVKLNRLQSICLDYQFRLKMKQLQSAKVDLEQASVMVAEISQEFSLPEISSINQVKALLTKYKLMGFVHV